MRKFNLFLLLSVAALAVFSCTKTPERPPYLPPEEEEGGDTKKSFYVYDALFYNGKPDLEEYKISKIRLIYEDFLLDGSKEIDFDKVETQISLAKLTNVKTISTDIEAWYSSRDAAGIKAGLTQVFDKFKAAIPDCNVGNYGVPVSDLNILRYNPNMEGKSETELIERWKSDSRKRMDAADVSDVLYPSLYAMNTDIEQYIKDLKTTADYIKAEFPGKKVLAYIWPQYYNLQSNPEYMKFISADNWTRILEACYENFDGVVLWSNGKAPVSDGSKELTDVGWADSRVQRIFSATRDFISRHYENIVLDTATSGGDDGQEPSEFHIWGDLGFTGTPRNLLKFGIEPINCISEASVSHPDKVDNILPPHIEKVKHVAKNASLPVIIRQSSWIIDRSTDNAAMAARFKSVYDAFKAENNSVTLGYLGVGPTPLTQLAAWNNYATDFARKDSWLRYAAQPTRVLRQYADVLYPEVTLINDDLDFWKSDCTSVFEEARLDNNGKKIYACLGTTYYGNKSNPDCFEDAFTPIKEETLLNALEYLYLHCDGIVFYDNSPKDGKAAYSEDMGFIKAVSKFYQNHKSLIDKTISTEVADEDDIPPFEGGGDEPEPEYREEIANGGFEEEVNPHSLVPVVHNNSLVRPVRMNGFFDLTAQVKFPDVEAGTKITDGTWFHRCSNNKWFWFTYIDDTTKTYAGGGTPYAHSGTRSAVVYSAFGATESHYSDYKSKMENLFGLAQTLALDDSKKYTLKFWYYVPSLVWSTKDANNVRQLNVGIVSSTGATASTDYTWQTRIDLAAQDQWTECSVTFDLPEIIAANPGKSFNKCAIFINPVPELNASGQTVKCLVNIDDVSISK